jgi:ABC-type Fe3+-hydroxamate transport system substrate-binding protein
MPPVRLEYFPRNFGRRNDTKMKEGNMKKIIIGMVCALVAPLAFAQTGITDRQTKTTTTTTEPTTTTESTTTTYESGTVTTYEPGKTIVVKSEKEGPISFALKAPVRIVDKAGHVVKRALTPKDRVRVYYTGTGETRAVEHVEVED